MKKKKKKSKRKKVTLYPISEVTQQLRAQQNIMHLELSDAIIVSTNKALYRIKEQLSKHRVILIGASIILIIMLV